MDTIGFRLRKEREALGFSQEEFAEKGGVQRRAQVRYESDERCPDGHYFSAIAAVGADVNYILTGEKKEIAEKLKGVGQARDVVVEAVLKRSGLDREMLADLDRKVFDSNLSAADIEKVLEERFPTSAVVMVPRYDVHGSAGGGAVNHTEHVIEYVAFDPAWVREVLRVSPDKLCLIGVRGTSMEPTLLNGEVILVDRTLSEIRDSDVYVIEYEGNLLIKRIQLRLDGTVVIKSDNTAYEPEILTSEDAQRLSVVGRVVPWKFGRFKL
ncbi:XRE family transcriptional regulator [Methylococcus mesophilus]|uniref:XRE family transcriptional regulator n=1 Tax=Methylococcus mesophilus TaxID=2993564 RepID=UPI00224B2C25|nr:S24 family peptidase [Methylococcus mesophilus]UZR27468.1 helix-turn-helix domain-containing protein [Methylococcus mesophilus]